MGFSGIDDYVTETTSNGKTLLQNFTRSIDTGATSVAGRWHSMLTTGGTGGAMTLTGTAGTGIVMNRSTAGALPYMANTSPDTSHLVRMYGVTPTATAVPATIVLTDIIHIYPSCVLTGTPSTLSNHPTWTGTGNTRMTNAVGVQASLLVTTATTAGNGQITPTYFDQDGNSTAAPRSLYAPSTTTPTGCFYGDSVVAVAVGSPYMPLASGDTGVQRIASYAINTGATTGVGAFILHRPIYELPLAAINTPSLLNLINEDPAFPRVHDDAC
ncbi:hypothetical protein UFOVP353_1, partial [uncultured Caudovirales phage]